jgi:hypothetical protein
VSDLQTEYQDHRIRLAQVTAAEELLTRVSKGAKAEGKPVAPATMPQSLPAQSESGVLETAGRVAKDVAGGIVETPRSIVKGVRDAYAQLFQMGDELAGWLEEKSAGTPLEFMNAGLKFSKDGVEWIGPDEALETPTLQTNELIPDLNAPKTVTGSMVKGVAQFLTGMQGAGKLFKAAGLPSSGYGAAAAKGAVANFGAFDPHQQRLSNLLEQFPALQNPVSAYLASDPNDNAAEGRFKNALEGVGLGVLTDGFFKGVKLLREAGHAKLVSGQADDAAKVASGAQRGVADDAFRGIGDETLPPEAPILQTPKTPDIDPANLGKGTQPPKTYINFARIDTPEDVQRVMQELADASNDSITAARRGKQSFEKIKLNAEQQNAWNVLKARRSGEPLNAEQSVAARQLWASSTNKLTELAEAAASNPSEANLFAFRKMLTVHDTIQQQVIAARTETARALASWRIPVGASSERLQDIAMRLEEAGGAELARELATRVSALGKAGMYNEMAAVVEKTAYARTRDAVLEGWINGLLSNPATHVANTASNSSVMALRMAERKVASSIARLLGDENSIQAGEAAAQWYGLTSGYKDAFRYAAKAARTGESGFGIGKIELPREGAITSEALNLASNTALGRGVDMLGSLVRTPGRALAAEDEFFKTVGYRMELHAQAVRQATQDVLRSPAAEGASNEALDAAFKARLGEIIANPPENIRAAAIDAAAYQTFTNAPGKLAQSIGRLTSHYPALKVILPFTRTPANILNFTFERTPLAPLMSQFRANIAAGGARRDLALAQVAIGTGVMMTTADLAMNGQITGRGPTEKGQRQALARSGWQPYSIKVGDRWYAFNRLDPVGSLLGMSADVVDALRNAQAESLDDPDTERLAVAGSIAVAGNLINKTYLSGLSSVFEAMSDPQAHGEATIQRMVGSVIPAGAAAVNRQMDPYQREVYSMLDAIKARTPGLSDSLSPRRNLWGEPLKWESGLGRTYDFLSPVYTKPGKAEAIDKEILRLGANLAMPSRKTSFDGATVDLGQHPQIYSRYLELAGNELKHPAWGLGAKDLLNAIVSGDHPLSAVYQIRSDGPDGGKELYIRDILNQYREMARRQLIQEFPELSREVAVKHEKRRAIRMPVLN